VASGGKTSSAKRGKGRPSTAVLSRERIFTAALALVDDLGEDSLTIAGLAKRLGVDPSSLYNHVSGRGEIIEGIRGLIVDEIGAGDFTEHDWDIALEGLSRRYLDVLSRHPMTIHLLASTPIRAEDSMRMYDAISRSLLEAGWPADQIVSVIGVLESFILGSALDLAAPPQMYTADGRTEDYPHLTEALAAVPDPEGRASDAFEFGLRLLIGSLRAEVETRRKGSRPRRSSH